LSRFLACRIFPALLLCGCVSPTEFLNEDFVQSLGLTSTAARLPGEAPSVVIGFRNETGRTIEFQLSWRDGDGDVQTRGTTLFAGANESNLSALFAEFCPVTEVTLGDVSDLSATGAVVRLGGGSLTDPFVQVEAFGQLLVEGVHYDCGDRIVFFARLSGSTPSGYQIFAEIERDNG
jgi:hypothetical protein